MKAAPAKSSGQKPRRSLARTSPGPARRRQGKGQADWSGLMDAAETCCRAIEVLSGLLLACSDDNMMDTTLVSGAGDLIAEQVRQLKDLLKRARAAR
jgi:hypothetical protein